MPLVTGRAILEGTFIRGMKILNSVIQSTKIDMGYQPITSLADPVNPSDAATKYYVENTVASAVKTTRVHLCGVRYTHVANLVPGSYMVMISSVNGGPTATFVVSKNLAVREAHVARITSLPTEGTYEELDLKWGASGGVMLRKTGTHFDGCYIVKFVGGV